MKTRIIASILFLLCALITTAQTKSLSILSETTHQGIPYVTIQFIANNEIVGGTYSNENGYVDLKYPKDTEAIKITHLNYETETWPITELEPVIYLMAKNEILNEIVLQSKSSKNHNKRNKNNLFISAYKGMELATLIQNEHLVGKKIEAISFVLLRRKDLNASVIRLHLYANNNETPGELLNSQWVITKKLEKNDKGSLELDLSTQNIVFPKEGLFIGIEWLGLAEKDGALIENNAGNDVSFGFIKSTTKQATFIRKTLANEKWKNVHPGLYNINTEQTPYIYPSFRVETY